MRVNLVSDDYRGSSHRAVSKAQIPEPGAEPSLCIWGAGRVETRPPVESKT
jgi:hypothetical protein